VTNKPSRKKSKPPRCAKADVADVKLESQRAVVGWKNKPPERSRSSRQIAPRRPAPAVPAGDRVADDDASPPVDIEEPCD
jgi:hypothetical protein